MSHKLKSLYIQHKKRLYSVHKQTQSPTAQATYNGGKANKIDFIMSA